jgi:predicted dehydrogenase
MGPVDVDDLALLQLRMADGSLGTVEATRFGTGAANDLLLEIYGERGSLRFSLADPAWLQVYDTADSLRGFRKLETIQRYEGQKAPDWTAMPGFVRTHTECQYQFLRAIWDDRPAYPSLADGLRVQEVMDAACRSAAAGRWATIDPQAAMLENGS